MAKRLVTAEENQRLVADILRSFADDVEAGEYDIDHAETRADTETLRDALDVYPKFGLTMSFHFRRPVS